MNNNVKLHWQSAILRGKWCRERDREGVMETRDIEVSSHVMRAEVKVLVAPFIGCAIFIPEYFIHASNYFEHTAYVSAKNFCIVVLHNCWFLGFLCLPQLTFTVKVNTRSVGNQTSILCIDDGNMKNRPLPYSAPKIKIKQKYLDLHSYYIFAM